MDFWILEILTYQVSFFYIFGMENGMGIIFVPKWFLIRLEYSDSKITIWPPDNISLIYWRLVTKGKPG